MMTLLVIMCDYSELPHLIKVASIFSKHLPSSLLCENIYFLSINRKDLCHLIVWSKSSVCHSYAYFAVCRWLSGTLDGLIIERLP